MEETTDTAPANTATTETVVAAAPAEEKKQISLQERLAKSTEKKDFKATVTAADTPKGAKAADDFFGSDDDFEQPAALAASAPSSEKKTEEEKESSTEQKTERSAGSKGPITEKAKWSSARTAVGMLDLTQKGIFTPLHTWKFNKKFSSEEKEKILDIEDKEAALLDDKEKALKRKWDRLLKKYEKKKEQIPLNEQERKDLESAFYNYFDYKQKELSPEWFIGMAIVNSIGSRTIDLITD